MNRIIKTSILVLAVSVVSGAVAALAAIELNGKWSGGWTPQGGVRDAVTVEFNQESATKITGRFLTPVPMEFTKVTLNATSGAISLEAVDAKSGKPYRIDGKVEGTELKGTMKAGDVSGEVRLIKWTYVPR